MRPASRPAGVLQQENLPGAFLWGCDQQVSIHLHLREHCVTLLVCKFMECEIVGLLEWARHLQSFQGNDGSFFPKKAAEKGNLSTRYADLLLN